MLSHKPLKAVKLYCISTSSINFVCVTSRLIDVVSVFQIKLSKENLCVSHLSSIQKNAIEKEARHR